jgi:hypothetical protein
MITQTYILRVESTHAINILSISAVFLRIVGDDRRDEESDFLKAIRKRPHALLIPL